MWHELLDRFGYAAVEPPGLARPPSQLRIRALRPADDAGPAAVIDILEEWATGGDPDGLGVEEDDCHLQAASWHAQIAQGGDVGAERIDLQRAKPRPLIIHRHPFGEPNEVRVPAAPLLVPARWVAHVERLIFIHLHGPG